MKAVLIIIVIVPITMVLNGYAFSMLWNWFIHPLFSLPNLNVLQAIGVCMVLSYNNTLIAFKDDVKEKDAEYLLPFIKPATALLFGYIVHLFY